MFQCIWGHYVESICSVEIRPTSHVQSRNTLGKQESLQVITLLQDILFRFMANLMCDSGRKVLYCKYMVM